jgi:type II secretory pathway pseudopilin PulG
MTPHRYHETGDTLVEILITIVVIGITAIASFYAISVGATSSKSHRDAVLADTALRNYAEATKQAARDLPCTSSNPGASFGGNVAADYTSPSAGFPLPTATGLTCPPVNGVGQVHITVTLPDGTTKILDVDVRTP